MRLCKLTEPLSRYSGRAATKADASYPSSKSTESAGFDTNRTSPSVKASWQEHNGSLPAESMTLGQRKTVDEQRSREAEKSLSGTAFSLVVVCPRATLFGYRLHGEA